MRLPKLTDLAKGIAEFDRYEGGSLWYKSFWSYEEENGDIFLCRFEFPVPVLDSPDTGGSFGAKEKGITLMRWIRKHLEFLQQSIAQETVPGAISPDELESRLHAEPVKSMGSSGSLQSSQESGPFALSKEAYGQWLDRLSNYEGSD